MTLLQRPPLELRHEFFHVDRILKPEGGAPKRPHKVVAVMPAYNAERTLAATLADVPVGSVDEVILVDDGSTDRTVQVARDMGIVRTDVVLLGVATVKLLSRGKVEFDNTHIWR